MKVEWTEMNEWADTAWNENQNNVNENLNGIKLSDIELKGK